VQLLRRDAGIKVLACTPSDAAADVLVEHLLSAGLDSDSLYHLESSSQYEYEDTSEDAQTSSPIPNREKLLAFRLIVSTCSSASILQTSDVPVGHFSHIVIDDATQVEEPLAMIPIMTFSDTYTNVILAGDPNQLGPAIMSPTAAKAGLEKSYLERLMLTHEVYGFGTQVGKT
jgi:helicase MOV-10